MVREGLHIEFECRKCQDCQKCNSSNEINLLPITDMVIPGLKGGVNDEVRKNNQLNNFQSQNHLKLLNQGTDCFVNATLQIFRYTGYAIYLTTVLPPLLEDASWKL